MLATESDAESAAVAWLRAEYDINDPSYPISALVMETSAAGWVVHIHIGSGAFMTVRVAHDGAIERAPTEEA
ncbi:MAG TPA: hypothetical protein VNL77_08665 [Roseiflexaceae bacterium]|nr:hypothetical protein [Roseiflexaceae bacterium]